MFIDEANITIQAGHGGKGKVSFYPGLKAGPDGGNGGKGGNVYIRVTSDLTALKRFSSSRPVTAVNGTDGGSKLMVGKDGSDIEILIPMGSVLRELDSGEELELVQVNQQVLIAKGGLGGRGNAEFKSSRRTTPTYAQPGLDGELKHFRVSLRLIADFGLIGLPSAGKSSLLNELTATSVKVADYPFTTLEPNLGILNKCIIADIPGLIEGASLGKGLGVKFLKHIERTNVLVHLLAADSDDLNRDYQIVRQELGQFNPELLEKTEIILVSKSDLVSPAQLKTKLAALKKLKSKIYSISIHDWDSLEKLKEVLLNSSK